MQSTTKAYKIDTRPLDINLVDSRVWPTDYTLSRMRAHVATRLSEELGGEIEADKLFSLLEAPKNPQHGHLSLPLPQLRLPGNPVQRAADLARTMVPDPVIKEVSSVGPFLNVRLCGETILRETIQEVLAKEDLFGHNKIGEGKRIGYDFSSPNIAKPFHAGHLRSTIIGNFIRNCHKACGFQTYGINYLGDWGKQYGLLAVGFLRYGQEEELRKDPIRHLFNVYVRINKDAEEDPAVDDLARSYFKRMEDGDAEALTLWRRFRELSIVKYREVYKRLNIQFDEYSGESVYEGRMDGAIEDLRKAGLLKESKGAQVVDLTEYDLGIAMILKNDGSTLYMTRDLAAQEDRFARLNLDKEIIITAAQQDHYFRQLIKVLKLAGKPFADHLFHISFGMVNGMKTRKGNVVFLEDIIDDAHDTMLSVMQQNPSKYAQIEDPERTADILAVSALFVQDMAARRVKDYDFKIERVTQFEGDTGPYLQYAHSRLCSIERKAGEEVVTMMSMNDQILDLLSEPEAFDLSLSLARFPDVIQEARIGMEPCTVVNYLMALSRQVSTCLDRLWVTGQETRLAAARLALYKAARIVLGNGLRLIGLVPLERM